MLTQHIIYSQTGHSTTCKYLNFHVKDTYYISPASYPSRCLYRSVAYWLCSQGGFRGYWKLVNGEMEQQYRSVPQRKQAYWEYWLTHHQSPSWLVVANALYMVNEYGALEVSQKTYLKGTL